MQIFMVSTLQGKGFFSPHITYWSNLSGKMRINEGWGGAFGLTIRQKQKRGYKLGNFIAVTVFVANV